MNKLCVIVIPCVALDDYVLESIRGCLGLAYDRFHIALVPDKPITLPPDLASSKISVIVTGDVTIAAKRNIAIRHFRAADYVALLDSDAYPEPRWLAGGVRFLEENPEVWAVGGPNLTPPREPFQQRVVGNAQQSLLVSGPLHFAKKRSTGRECSNLHSCNLILPRLAFDAVGGFDETLFTGEDRNLCDRIRSAGKRLYFHEDVVVYHHNRPLWFPFFRQRLTYGYCSAAIGKRHFNRQNLVLHLPLAWLAVFAALVLGEAYASRTMSVSLAFVAMNLTVATGEAARVSPSLREIPHTLAAILLCYLATTLGQLLALAGYELPLKRIYAQRSHPTENVT